AWGEKRPQARFWRGAPARREGDRWIATLPIVDASQPLRAIANVTYQPGYTLTSAIAKAVPAALGATRATGSPSRLIDDFSAGTDAWTFTRAHTDPWRAWKYFETARGPGGTRAMTLNATVWGSGEISFAVGTHKIADPAWTAPPGAALAFWYRSAGPATLELHAWTEHWGAGMKEYTTKLSPERAGEW